MKESKTTSNWITMSSLLGVVCKVMAPLWLGQAVIVVALVVCVFLNLIAAMAEFVLRKISKEREP